jgi:serine/threonine protein kinase
MVRISEGDKESEEIVVKEFRTRGINKIKSVVLHSKAYKAWLGSNQLKDCGIKTPVPVAFLEKKHGLFLEQSFFLSGMVRGIKEIRHLFPSLSGDELRLLLKELARFLLYSHQQGILHRDLSDGNILVRKDGQGEYTFYLIDTNRIRKKKRIRVLSRVKNLIRLGIPPASQREFLMKYLGKERLNNLFWFWYKLNKNTYSGFIGLKKKLRLKKIAEKLKIQ